MRIPLGNFGNALPDRQGATNVVDTGAAQVGQAVARLGGVIENNALNEQKKQQLEAEKKAEALRRVQRGQKLVAAELAADDLGNELNKKVRIGEIDSTAAREQMNVGWSKYKTESLADVSDDVDKAELGSVFDQYSNRQVMRFNDAQAAAMDDKQKGAVTAVFNDAVKMSLTDWQGATAKLFAVVDASTLPDASKVELKNRFTVERDNGLIKNQINSAGENIGQLKMLQKAVRDPGLLTGLQPDTREGYYASIQSKIDQAERAAKMTTDTRAQQAKMMIGDIEKQIATGKPIDPKQFEAVANATAGTEYAASYPVMVANYSAIQKFKALPLPQQADALRQLSATIDNTPSTNPAKQQEIKGIYERVYNEGLTQAKTAPLEYIAGLSGKPVAPLQLGDLTTPDGQDALSGQLRERFAMIAAQQKGEGMQVGSNPFYPEEVAAIKNTLAKLSDDKKLETLSMLAKASGSNQFYKSALVAITGDENPALLLAGLAHVRNLRSTSVVTKSVFGFKYGEQSSAGSSVAKLILNGDTVRQDKSVTLPADKVLQTAFNAMTEGALQVGTADHAAMLKMSQLIYAGLVAREGKTDEDGTMADEDLMKTAVELATGGISEHADAKIIRPYGMDESDFETAIDAGLKAAAANAGMDVSAIDDMPLLPIAGGREGHYNLKDGQGGVMLNPKTNRPIVVAVR